MKTSFKSKKPNGFTLVELLVVIAIIAALASMAFPAIQGVIRNAKVTESNKVANDIVISIEAFENDYGYLPYEGSPPSTDQRYVTDNADLLNVLMGLEDDVNTNEKEYFTADQAKNGLNGLTCSGDDVVSLVDSFGNPFEVLIDYDLDKKLEPGTDINAKLLEDLPSGENPTVRSKSSIVASPGANEDGWTTSSDDWKSSWAVRSW